MSTLVVFVSLYLLVTIGIGLYASRRVKDAKDYMVAGRNLPLYMSMATVFATWFGAETVLSVSATFAKDGLGGVVADPFGASICLVLAALLFARAFYRMNLLTIGDYYKVRYGKPVEVLTGVAITASYLGWTSAQMTALGLVFSVLSKGAISLNTGIMIGAAVVLVYTFWGGMWSVALTDMFQSFIIVVGLLVIAVMVGELAGGPGKVIAAAQAAEKFNFWPSGGSKEWLAFIASFLTVALGSIAQQDVFQRMTSAKDEDTAVKGTLIGGVFYFFFAFVPIFIAYAALVIDPSMSKLFAAEDGREIQRILPDLILNKMPVWAQVVFFGALLSAILSTASGALLAPAAIASENVIRPLMPGFDEKKLLSLTRVILVVFTACALLFALNSKSTMYEMVQNAYKVTLCGAFVPLFAGMFWKRATSTGAMTSIILGLGSWLLMEKFGGATIWPPQLVGLLLAIVGMVAGSLASKPAAQA
jgi:solute:Na+ symporter, SSS family